jgi:hypothetical protein
MTGFGFETRFRLRVGPSGSTNNGVMSIDVRPAASSAVRTSVWWWCINLREVMAD